MQQSTWWRRGRRQSRRNRYDANAKISLKLANLSEDAPSHPDHSPHEDRITIQALEALNDPGHESFEPTVFVTWDTKDIKLPVILDRFVLQPYIRYARTIVRVETDVVMLTHLILYFTTSLPSALYLYYRFSWVHGFIHWIMQSYYVGTYTLMMHQHIHMGGILSRKYRWFDQCFPYITDPLMGHTWNSYYYHHVKHHHVEANGPDDLSSTIRYQRDNVFHLLHYIGKFFFLIWLDLPLYFLGKNKSLLALRAIGWEVANYLTIYVLATYVNVRATTFVLILPLLVLRLGLMIGNWGQHAFVDETDPDSDFRSSITLIDVAVSDTAQLTPSLINNEFGAEQSLLLQ
jgi:phosphoinositide-3-kinase regulatory subunit 4